MADALSPSRETTQELLQSESHALASEEYLRKALEATAGNEPHLRTEERYLRFAQVHATLAIYYQERQD